MEAIVLAGWINAKYQYFLPDTQESSAKRNDLAYLENLFSYLAAQNIEKIVLSVDPHYQLIQSYFGDNHNNLIIEYSFEDEYLGTGGAIKQALKLTRNEQIFVFNGNTFFALNLKAFLDYHNSKNSDLTLALKPMFWYDRYDTIYIDENSKIIGFKEEGLTQSGYINGGVGVLDRNLFSDCELKENFSFEKDFLEKYYSKYNFYGQSNDNYFMDIRNIKNYAG